MLACIELILCEGFNVNECGAVPAAARNNMPKTKTYRAWLVGVVLAGVLLLLQSPADLRMAQDDQDQDNDQDPPSRVARMNYAQGSVTLSARRRRRLGDRCSQPAADQRRQSLDRPGLARRDCTLARPPSDWRPQTSLTLLDLDDRTTQLRLSEGTHHSASSSSR